MPGARASVMTHQHTGRNSVCIRSFDIAEFGTLHLDGSIALLCFIDNLLANVLAFSIAVGPYHQQASILGLVCYVLGNVLFVLRKD